MTAFENGTAGGVETGQPREGIEFLLPMSAYRIATGTRDVVIDGKLFTALPVQRGEEVVPTFTAKAGEMEVFLPLSHPLSQRYLAGEFPPKRVDVNVYSKQLLDSTSEQFWRGQIDSMEIESRGLANSTVKFKVPSRIAKALDRKLPTVTASRNCPHILYDQNCKANRAAFTVVGTVAAFSGRTVRVDVAMDDQWATGGELVHTPTGEAMTIFNQTSSNDLSGSHAHFTLQGSIYGLKSGDPISIAAGCAHDFNTCRNKFNNVQNYGGFPQLPAANPFLPNGLGVIRS